MKLLKIISVGSVLFLLQSQTTKADEAPYRLIVPDANRSAPQVWKYWGLSMGEMAKKIVDREHGEPITSPPSESELRYRKTYLDASFGSAAGGLNFNMLRFTMGSDFNPSFRRWRGGPRTPAEFDGLGLVRDIEIHGGNGQIQTYRVLTQSINRGICDIGNDPAWKEYARPGELVPQTMYCNDVLWKNNQPNLITSTLDFKKCFNPSINGWGDVRNIFDDQTETDDQSRAGTLHMRGLLEQSVSNIQGARKNPVIEAESMAAPYYAMDSRCSTGRDFDFTPIPIHDALIEARTPKNSVTGEGRALFAEYIKRVVSNLNDDLKPKGVMISAVEPFNGPFGYTNKFSDSGDTGGSMVTWKFREAFSFAKLLKENLAPLGAGVTGFDNDGLGGFSKNQLGSERADGGVGTFFALLSDRDSNQSAGIGSLNYISAHIPTGNLLRELSALAKQQGKEIAVTGQGCCDTPGAWNGPGQVVERRNSAPFAYPPIGGAYPSSAPGKRADKFWLGADKWSYVAREIIKYMGPTGWHFLSPSWGLFNVDEKNELKTLTPFFAVREFARAIPPGSHLVKVNDDNVLAATFGDSTGDYLSLIIYNGIFEKSIPTECPMGFACEGRPEDSFSGNVRIKDTVQNLKLKIDLSGFNFDPTKNTIVTRLIPDSQSLGGNSICPLNVIDYQLQTNPDVSGKLFYGGCDVATHEKQPGSVAAELPSYEVRPAPLKDWTWKTDVQNRMGITLIVPSHAIYFLKVPLLSRDLPEPLRVASELSVVDDQDAHRTSIVNNWTPKKETSFKYFTPQGSSSTEDSGLLVAATTNGTYTESKIKNAKLEATFSHSIAPRFRVFAVSRPQGALARIVVDQGLPTESQYIASTYGEYWVGEELLFDTGKMAPGTHTIKIFNFDGGALTIDKIESTDPSCRLVFK